MEIIDSRLIYKAGQNHEFLDESICFFDIETSGLNRDKDLIYLIGIVYFDREKDSWILRQYFAPELKDEIKVLTEAVDFLSNFDTIVNYNGNSFDIPFVNHRLKLLNLDIEIPKEKSLDIYAILRRNRDFLDLDNLKLTTVEKYLGIFREDIYTGRDCIQFYRDFLLNNNKSLKEKILRHNYDDLYYLLDVLKILDILKDNKSIRLNRAGHTLTLLIDRMNLENDFFTIYMDIETSEPLNISYYGDSYKIFVNDRGRLEFSFEVARGLISPSDQALFLVNKNFNLPPGIGKDYGYNISQDITIISINRNYLVDNIKTFVHSMLAAIL